MMTDKAIVHDANYYERIGFRAAWISVTQVPLIYLLSSKSSVIGCIIGSSHERLNWLHRWVSRTLLVTVTVHGGFFMREWVMGDIVKLELWMMPMVKYGIGAWSVLVWTFLSSLSPLRQMAYEIFVLQHIAAAATFLWLLWVHVPTYARYNIWFAIAVFSFDWTSRGILFVYRNSHLRGPRFSSRRTMGYNAELQAIGSDLTIITLHHVPFSWSPGQHLYLWLPRLGPLETHPFTIANSYTPPEESPCAEIRFAIRTQSGVSKRIYNYAQRMRRLRKTALLTAFVAGPYGVPPNWNAYETLVLLSASTGASFTLPILESVLHAPRPACVQRIHFLLIARDKDHISFYMDRLSTAMLQASTAGIDLSVEIRITGPSPVEETEIAENGLRQRFRDEPSAVETPQDIVEAPPRNNPSIKVKAHSPSSSTSSAPDSSPMGLSKQEKGCFVDKTVHLYAADLNGISYTSGRPVISNCIRHFVEVTGGETAVVVCGGKSLVATVRNSVASLSDERAVHKGTGAHGIFLHVEEYCF